MGCSSTGVSPCDSVLSGAEVGSVGTVKVWDAIEVLDVFLSGAALTVVFDLDFVLKFAVDGFSSVSGMGLIKEPLKATALNRCIVIEIRCSK